MRHDRTDEEWEEPTGIPNAPSAPFGLRPENEEGEIVNAIGFRFTISPTGIEQESDVKFDITRQIDRIVRYRVQAEGE